MTINELLNHFNILPDEIRIFTLDADLAHHFKIYCYKNDEHTFDKVFNKDDWQILKKQYLSRKVCDWEWRRRDDNDFLLVCVYNEDGGV